MSRVSKLASLLALGILTAGAAGAQTPLNAIFSADNATANGGGARVRVVHGSPDAPNVDVRVDGGLVFENVAFEGITGYAEVPAGTYRVQVEPAGADNAGPFVIDADLTLDPATDYTVIATDLLANLTPVVLVDDNSSPAAGNAHVRFFHGSPDAPAVDIAVTDGPVLFGDVPFQETGTYLPVPAGSYDLEVRVAGTDTVVLTLPGLALEEGVVYTAYATGLVADGASDRTLYLNDDRFRVEVTWRDFDDRTGFGRAVPFRDDTGIFWFFHDQNMETIVKVLDGTGVNGNYWVFTGAATNVEYTLNVTDTESGATYTYTNPLGNFASFGDTSAFPQN